MQLSTDIQVKRWQPKKNAARISCGQNLMVQGFKNGSKSWVFRLQYREAGKQKSAYLTLGHTSDRSNNGGVVGAALTLAEAREVATRASGLLKRGKATISQIRQAIFNTCEIDDFELAVCQSLDAPKVDKSYKIEQTFDQCFWAWYDLQTKANRWTHKDSLKRPKVAYVHVKTQLGHLPINEISRRLVKAVLQDMYMNVTDLAGKMRGYCEEVFENALDDRLIDHNPVPPAKNFTVPNKKTKHHGTIAEARLPDLYRHILNCNYTASFKACAIALIVSGLRVSNIALLRQENYHPRTGEFIIPEKTGEADADGLMKSGREYTGVFPDGVRKLINDQLVEGHDHVFVSQYNNRCINPESLRKLFKGFDKQLTSHGMRNMFKEWANNNDVAEFLADRYVDHDPGGLDKAYRRYDTLQARSDIARRYYAYMVTGATPTAELKVVA